MDDLKLKNTIAQKLISYRKANGFTQAELAEKINYSDKSVSKWERGEGVPDIFVLSMLAEIYGITVNDFLTDEPVSDKSEKTVHSFLNLKNKLMITLLSVGLVWLVASIVFFLLKIILPDLHNVWFTFVVAVPVSFIVAVVFCELWGNLLVQAIAVSMLMWSMAVCLDVCFNVSNLYLIYLVVGVLQVLTIFWYLLKYKPRKETESEQEDEDITEPD